MKNKIYVDPDWISGETCVFNISNTGDRLYAKGKISQMRKPFVEKLTSEGYEIIDDGQNIDVNTICLTPYQNSLVDDEKSIVEYKRAFDKQIKESAGDSFSYPKTQSLEEYFKNPFFPAVFKNELTNGGKDKFLIENEYQLSVIMDFYNRYITDEKFHEDLSLCVAQQYLESPTKFATYMRVLCAGSGDVMGASLKYANIISKPSDNFGLLDGIFLSPTSRYYIAAKKMFNYYSGGGEIGFCQPKYSHEKAKILEEHNIDAKHIAIPEQIMEVCNNVMRNCNREIGVMCGFDFMMNKEDGKWYYLENQAFPAVDEWAQVKRLRVPTFHGVDSYLEMLKLSLQAREEALRLTIEQRNDDNYQPRLLK